MTQYKNLFGSCRVPSGVCDKVQFTSTDDESSRNVLVISNNQFFVFNAHDERGIPFNEGTILTLLLRVAEMSRGDGTALGILTTEERDAWAEAHERLCQIEDDKVYQVYWAGDARTKGSFYDAKLLYMAAEAFFRDDALIVGISRCNTKMLLTRSERFGLES
ncbi:carnitine O-acetyltransferase-like [Ixodes scapularis]